MNTNNETFDYIEYFIANEKKQKKITVFVGAFLTIFILAILVLSYEVSKQVQKIKSQGQELVLRKGQIDSLKEVMRLKDTLKVLKERTSKLTEDSTKTVRTFETSSKPTSNTSYVVYIQFMDKFESEVETLRKALAENNYKVPKAELMGQSFKPSIRYFDPSAKEEALKVSKLANGISNVDFDVEYVNLKAPKKNIEVWLGKKD